MADSSAPKKQRKERAQLSCTFCRHRKLKCDRQSPCGNCLKRSRASNCHFAHPRSNRVEKAASQDVQSRVKHLENLVLTLMSGQGPRALQTPSDSLNGQSLGGSASSDQDHDANTDGDHHDQTLRALGKLNVSGRDIQYVGNEHWASVLDDIAEVKKHIENADSPDDPPEFESEQSNEGPELLLGAGRMPSKEEIIELFPPKPEVDRLIAAYFASADPVTMILHTGTFQSDYDRFWADPSSAPLTWIGLLYSIMAMATFLQLAAGDNSPEEAEELAETMASYRQCAAQALIVANYTKPVRWTIETMMVYLMSEYVRSLDMQVGLWVLLGTVLRLSMRMGYHRDSKQFSQISPFHGEMRRRVWALLVQLDLISSVQFGLPRLIRAEQTDTELPGNYLDDDLSEKMGALPPVRPDSQFTPMSYHIMKGRLTRVLGSIADAASATRSGSYDSTLRLDAELIKVYESLPAALKVRSIANSVTDSTNVVFKRYTLDILYHKSRCILHRKYIVPARTNDRYTFSLACAIQSAKAVLEHQVSMFEETQPGGRLYKDRWMMSGLTAEDFTLAAMVICLSVDTYMNSTYSLDDINYGGDKDEIITLLEKSRDIWDQWKNLPMVSYAKAAKASEVLSIMLAKVQAIFGVCLAPRNRPALEKQEQDHTQPAAISLLISNPHPPLAPSGRLPNFQQPTPDSTMSGYLSGVTPVNEWIDAPQDINWDEWDDLFHQSVEVMEIPNDGWDGNMQAVIT